MTLQITGKNYLAGQPSSKGANTFTSINPHTQKQAEITFSDATKDEVNHAVRYASEAFKITRKYTDKQIAIFMNTVADEIMALGDQLIEVADWETALGTPRLKGERGRTCNQLRAFGEYIQKGYYKDIIIDEGDPEREPTPKPDIRREMVPLGPVGVFGASNFPFAFGVVGGDTASAWAARCPVIAKGHPSHPQTSELFAKAIYKAISKCNFPTGFFSLIQGQGLEPGQELVVHPRIEAIGFTGSLRGGRAIYNLAAQRSKPIPIYAEMGSINPVFLMKSALDQDDDDLENLAEIFVNSITLGVGQFCTKPGVFFLPSVPSTDRFIDILKEQIDQQEVGTLLNNRICGLLEKEIKPLKEKNYVDVKTGGHEIAGKNAFSNTLLITTASEFLKNKDLRMEKFGPVSLMVKCKSTAQYVKMAEELEGQLTGSIFFNISESKEEELIQNLTEILQYRVGRIIYNGVPTGVEVCHAMQHGGPYPATTAPWSTSVGMTAIRRFLRPVAFQNVPDSYLPKALQDGYSRTIKMVNGQFQQENE